MEICEVRTMARASYAPAFLVLGALLGCGGAAATEPIAAYGVRWKLVVDEVKDYLAPWRKSRAGSGAQRL
jgi:hypothetical protein